MSWQIRQAVSSDIEFLMDIDPLAKTELGRQEHIERAVGSLGCWVACATNDPRDAAITRTARISRQWPSRES